MTAHHAAMLEHMIEVRKAANSYEDYVRLMYPAFDFPEFQLELIRALDLLEKRQLVIDGVNIRNLLITMPPRHAKTTWATINFPTYFLGRDPSRFVMSASYNGELAKGFGRSVRDIMSEPLYRKIFPNSEIASDKRAANTFHTTNNGAYYGVGLGGTTSGRAANLLITDDPLKSRPDAESPTIRNRVWEFYSSALRTRLQPEKGGEMPIQLVILTRWHPDDLAGRLMKTSEWQQGMWHHIDFPALTPIPGSDPVVYKSLWPERFPVAELLRIKQISERDFEALYQQRPVVLGGNLIKSEWFRSYERPEDTYMSIVITVDTAFQTHTVSDYTVFCVCGLTQNGDIHLLDIQRGKWEFPEAKRRLIALNTLYRGRGLRGVYIENRASGQSLIQELRRESGISVLPYDVGRTDKVMRATVTMPIIEGGRVYLPDQTTLNRPWLPEFISEMSQFPSSTHDDQVDAFIMALDILSRMSVSPGHIEQLFDLSQSLNNIPMAGRSNKSLKDLMSNRSAPRPLGW